MVFKTFVRAGQDDLSVEEQKEQLDREYEEFLKIRRRVDLCSPSAYQS